ncbi:MAG: hypothetical protein WC851_03605 [Candidatus Shapirobacteria bacterium]|jgi:hypothetical protein
MAESDDDLRKQIAAAADNLIHQIVTQNAPGACPERTIIHNARISFYMETLSAIFSCPGHANMPVCRECKIKGSFQVGIPRGKNVM